MSLHTPPPQSKCLVALSSLGRLLLRLGLSSAAKCSVGQRSIRRRKRGIRNGDGGTVDVTCATWAGSKVAKIHWNLPRGVRGSGGDLVNALTPFMEVVGIFSIVGRPACKSGNVTGSRDSPLIVTLEGGVSNVQFLIRTPEMSASGTTRAAGNGRRSLLRTSACCLPLQLCVL